VGLPGLRHQRLDLRLRDAATSVTASLDVEIPYRMVRAQHLPGALERGEASWSDVDAAVERLVATLLRFDGVLSAPASPVDVAGSTDHRALAARWPGARSCCCATSRSTVRLSFRCGPAACAWRCSAVSPTPSTWATAGRATFWDLDCHTVLDGLRSAVGDVGDVVHDDGSDAERAAAVAAEADVAVVVVGYTYLDEGEYIGETDPSLPALFPPADEPDVVECFRASLAQLSPTNKPDRLTSRPRGFSEGGDRSSGSATAASDSGGPAARREERRRPLGGVSSRRGRSRSLMVARERRAVASGNRSLKDARPPRRSGPLSNVSTMHR